MKHGQLVTDLEEGGPSGDVLQRTCVDTTSPLSLSNPQLSVTHHRSGGEGVGVAATGAITGLRGGAVAGGWSGCTGDRWWERWEWIKDGER